MAQHSSVGIDDRTRLVGPCGQQPPGQITFGGRAGVPDTMTFRIQAPSSYWAAAYAKRPASWTIAIYQEGS